MVINTSDNNLLSQNEILFSILKRLTVIEKTQTLLQEGIYKLNKENLKRVEKIKITARNEQQLVTEAAGMDSPKTFHPTPRSTEERAEIQ